MAGPPDRMMALGGTGPKRLFRLVERHDLGIDARLAHPPGDELGVLRPEIDDQHAVVLGRGRLRIVALGVARKLWRFVHHGGWL